MKAIILTLFISLVLVSSECFAIDCYDYRNNYVRVIPIKNLNDAAEAKFLSDGTGVMLYNPNATSRMSSVMRDFTFAHECAHLSLGHGVIRPLSEQAADCWAIRTLASFGLNLRGLRQLQSEISRFGRGDWTHLPGIVRARNLQMCLQ